MADLPHPDPCLPRLCPFLLHWDLPFCLFRLCFSLRERGYLCRCLSPSPRGPPVKGSEDAYSVAWAEAQDPGVTYSLLKVKSLSRLRPFATPWTVAYQAPLSMGFSRQGYWSGLPFPSLGDLPNSGIEPGSPTLQTDALPSEPPGKP